MTPMRREQEARPAAPRDASASQSFSLPTSSYRSSDDSRATIRFELVNIQEENGLVDGYVHVIAGDGSNEPRRIWAFRPQVLRNGVPLN